MTKHEILFLMWATFVALGLFFCIILQDEDLTVRGALRIAFCVLTPVINVIVVIFGIAITFESFIKKTKFLDKVIWKVEKKSETKSIWEIEQ